MLPGFQRLMIFQGHQAVTCSIGPARESRIHFQISSSWIFLVGRFVGGEVPISSPGVLVLLHPPAAAPGSRLNSGLNFFLPPPDCYKHNKMNQFE